MKIEGKQIVLRDWQPNDVDVYCHWLQPGHRWQELDGPYYPGSTSEEIEKIRAALPQKIESGDWPEPRQRLLIAGREDDALYGQVTWYWQSQETDWLSVGISIYDPAHWGRGFGFEALGLWSDYLLAQIPQLRSLDLRTWSGNVGMMRLAEKLGYTLEARFRQARVVNGRVYDGIGYGVLRSEWQTRYPDGFAAMLGRPRLCVQTWDDGHPRWADLLTVIDSVGQKPWAIDWHDWYLSSHMLVALLDDAIAGFLRLVRQPIGPDMACETVTVQGEPLVEAKVMVFAVAPAYRRQGVGRVLQAAAIREARALGCYQLRSYSNGEKLANHQLKLGLGFGVQPHIRDDDNRGVFFVMPLAVD